MTALSAVGSYAIINFVAANPPCNPDFIDSVMEREGWTKEETTYFGNDNFNYGRYPAGKPASENFGFSFYKKVKSNKTGN